MITFLVRRFLLAIVTIWLISVLSFVIIQLPPGDFVDTYIAQMAASGSQVSAEAANAMRQLYGLDRPMYVQYAKWIVRVVQGDFGESMEWRRGAVVPADASYRLCRCGQSSHKPFCDGTHARVEFDGTETAPTQPSEERRKRFPSPAITLTDDEPLCISAAFCHSRTTDVWEMVGRSGDTDARFELIHRVRSCPSGRLVTEQADGVHEADLSVEIGIIKDGPYWVTGGVTVTMSDGRTLEVRNRVTLCRCGQSSNKPLCDGTHQEIGFSDG